MAIKNNKKISVVFVSFVVQNGGWGVPLTFVFLLVNSKQIQEY